MNRALKTLIPITTKRAIRQSGMSPVHYAADGGHASCLNLLIEKGFDVNALLADHISNNYGDTRKTALYFAVSNGDVTCAEMLLEAGAKTDLDPLFCLLVAVRASHYELVRLLLAHGANVNCFFTAISDTMFPTALQYCVHDDVMMRLLLNNGYRVESCFQCEHSSIWTQSYVDDTCSNFNKVTVSLGSSCFEFVHSCHYKVLLLLCSKSSCMVVLRGSSNTMNSGKTGFLAQ